MVPGGFGYRGVEGKVQAARWARESHVPYLGLCLGMQVMCIEYARHVLGWEDANSTEFDNTTGHPVIDLMPDQRTLRPRRHDAAGHTCVLKPGSKAAEAYQVSEVSGGTAIFEVNNAFRDQLEQADCCSPASRRTVVSSGSPRLTITVHGRLPVPSGSERRRGPTLCLTFIRAVAAYHEMRTGGGGLHIGASRPVSVHPTWIAAAVVQRPDGRCCCSPRRYPSELRQVVLCHRVHRRARDAAPGGDPRAVRRAAS